MDTLLIYQIVPGRAAAEVTNNATTGRWPLGIVVGCKRCEKGKKQWKMNKCRNEEMKEWRNEGMERRNEGNEGIKKWRNERNEGIKKWRNERNEGIKKWRNEGNEGTKKWRNEGNEAIKKWRNERNEGTKKWRNEGNEGRKKQWKKVWVQESTTSRSKSNKSVPILFGRFIKGVVSARSTGRSRWAQLPAPAHKHQRAVLTLHQRSDNNAVRKDTRPLATFSPEKEMTKPMSEL